MFEAVDMLSLRVAKEANTNLHSLKILNLIYSLITTSADKCLSSSRKEADMKGLELTTITNHQEPQKSRKYITYKGESDDLGNLKIGIYIPQFK